MPLIKIEVAYATSTQQTVIPLVIDTATTVTEAIQLSHINTFFPDLDLTDLIAVGVYGKKIDTKTYVLQDEYRIEIYRPLNKTPNQKRLERLKK